MDLNNLPNEGSVVRIIKRAVCPRAVVQPGSWDQWKPGSYGNIGSLPVDYEVVGVLLAPIKIGKPIRIWRIERNEVCSIGHFITTQVKGIGGPHAVYTANSVYSVSAIPQETEPL